MLYCLSLVSAYYFICIVDYVSNYFYFVLAMLHVYLFFFFKQKTAYERRISDWSSDVCSSDLPITGRDSYKDVRHLEISLEGSQLDYQPGDALGVWPVQSDTLISQVIDQLGLDADENIEIDTATRSLKEWLGRHRELTQLTKPFLLAHAELAGSETLKSLLKPEGIDALKHFLETRQLLDLLVELPAKWTAQGLVKALRPLTPRMYSIASSQSAVGQEVHLTLANVAYEYEGQARWGVASNFLSQLAEGEKLPIFIEENPRFRLPADTSRDVIMIGPGTGIADRKSTRLNSSH